MKEFDEFEYADIENDSYGKCESCNGKFLIEDLDLVNGKWICKYCEEKK